MNTISNSHEFDADIAVVGGGLAGLTAAALTARAGRTVVVFEKTGHWGGRAITTVRNGIHFNMGPHALYCRGDAFRLLTELRVPFSGRFPNPGCALLTDRDAEYAIPQGFGSLVASRLLSIGEKWRLARLLSSLPRLETQQFDRMSLADWIRNAIGGGNLARFFEALFRVSTYVNDPEQMSAGAALHQLKLALAGNVWYLDGGWRTLITGLTRRAIEFGAETRGAAEVKSVVSGLDGVSLCLADGQTLRFQCAILAVDPESACKLLDLPEDDPIARWMGNRTPVRAECLDVALDRLPRPNQRFALGLNRPLYYSVHSAAADLAPAGIAVVHVMKYAGNEATSPEETLAELEGYLDRLQPGWRDHVVARRLLPNMIVNHALPHAGGFSGRPIATIPERQNIFLAGDWVGPRGWLADASAASAETAATRALAILADGPIQPRRKLSYAAN